MVHKTFPKNAVSLKRCCLRGCRFFGVHVREFDSLEMDSNVVTRKNGCTVTDYGFAIVDVGGSEAGECRAAAFEAKKAATGLPTL